MKGWALLYNVLPAMVADVARSIISNTRSF